MLTSSNLYEALECGLGLGLRAKDKRSAFLARGPSVIQRRCNPSIPPSHPNPPTSYTATPYTSLATIRGLTGIVFEALRMFLTTATTIPVANSDAGGLSSGVNNNSILSVTVSIF